MNLSSTGAFVLRKRSLWEAVDSGLLLWRKNFIYFLPFFALPFWVCAFGLRLLPERLHVFAWLILWFLKPLFDRPLLHVISARFFENDAGGFRLCRGLAGNIFRGLAGDLLWRRFSPLRSSMMPVRVLEHLKFSRIKERRRALKKGGLGFCFLLTLWGIVLEAILLAGEILFFLIMMQIIYSDFADSYNEYITNTEILIFTAWCVNSMLVESIYVCMGFGLYLNSRVEVEGWDIDIMFKNLGKKINSKSIIPVIIIFMTFNFFVPSNVFAKGLDTSSPPESGAAPLETLRVVLDSPDFGGERESWGLRFKNQKKPKEAPELDLAPWLEKIRHAFAVALRLVLIMAIAALAVFLFFYFLKKDRRKISLKSRKKTTFVPEKAEESPEFLLEKARRFFEQNELRLAWGFCAAAAIRFLAVRGGLVFPPNATEYGCLEIAREKISHNSAGAFAALIQNWVNFAYGGRIPSPESFEEAFDFCKSLGKT